MADGLAKKDNTTPIELVEPSLHNGPELHARNDVDVSDANFPKRRAPVSAGTLRLMAKLTDTALATFITWYCLHMSGSSFLGATVYEIIPYLLIPVVISWGLRTASAYDFAFNRSAFDHMVRCANGCGLPLAALGLSTWFFYGRALGYWPVVASLATWLGLIAIHAHFLTLIKSLTRQGRLSENIVIVGATPNAQRLIARNAETRELNIVGVFDDRLSRAPKSMSGVPLLGRLDDLLAWERLPEIDRIVVTVTSGARDRVRGLIDRLRILPQRVVLLLDLEGFDPETESLAEIARSPAAYVSGTPRDTRRALVKRVADVGFSILLLIAFSPLLAVVAIAIRLDSPGPIFFRQRRHGFNNQIIRVWKFRSMRNDPDAAEKMYARIDEMRRRGDSVGGVVECVAVVAVEY